MTKSCVVSSPSNDTYDGMLEGSSVSEDSENGPLAHVIHQPAVNKGTKFRVKFAKKQRIWCNVGGASKTSSQSYQSQQQLVTQLARLTN